MQIVSKPSNYPSFKKKPGRRRAARRRIVRKSGTTRYPFNMHRLVDEGKITVEQRDKFMQMLTSPDEEIEILAVTILRKILGMPDLINKK